MSRTVAVVRAKPNAVLGLATGATMEPVYAGLVEAHRNGLSFDHVVTFNLDEYVGLSAEHPASYHATMRALFFEHIGLRAERGRLPDGMAGDLPAAAQRYEDDIRGSGGIDLQLLGIGRNGHIGFNEPGAEATSRTRGVMLHRSTLEANRSFFAPDEVMPTWAITMGVATILDARSIVLLATGRAKADAVYAAIEGEVGVECPASFLRGHPDVQWNIDVDAAARLT